MTLWTSLFPDEAVLLGRVFKKDPGQYNVLVPTTFTAWPGKTAKFCRAHAVGVGGQGDHWGGSSARARAIFTVTPGETLACQVGDSATASTPGDSWIKRTSGALLLYADRGRGNGDAGLAANSFGDVLYDGQPGNQGGLGGALTDQGDYSGLIEAGAGSDYQFTRFANPGCGGHGATVTDVYGNVAGKAGWCAGTGLLIFEWFDSNPNY